MRRLALPTLFALLTTLSGCLLTRTGYVVPPTVQPGQVFEITVTGSYPTTGQPSVAGCILQVPNGFTVLGAANSTPILALRDDPQFLAAYAAEPGHYLASWSGTGVLGSDVVRLKVFLQAPTSLGAHMFKVSLARRSAAVVDAMDPLNIFNFANVAGGAALPCAVAPTPTVDFGYAAPGLPLAIPGAWSGLALGDLNGDGVTDLGATMANGQGATCFTSGPGGGWAPYGGALPTNQGGQIALGHLDTDGRLDLVDADGRTWFGTGAGFVAGPVLALPPGSSTVAAGDIDGDGLADLAFARLQPPAISLFRSVGNRTFTVLPNAPAAPNATLLPRHQLLLQDVTDDGVCDLLWANSAATRLWVGNGGSAWVASTGLPNDATAVAAADLDGDGTTELLVASAVLQLAPGLRGFRRIGGVWTQTFVLAGLTTAVATLDFDRDGALDIAIGIGAFGSATPSRLELLRQVAPGQFTPAANTGLAAVCTQAPGQLEVGDFNDDTFPDLATVVPNEGVLVYLNQRGGLSRFGTGCALPNFALQGNGAPILGSATFALQLQGGTQNGVGFLWLGDSRRNWSGAALPLGLGLFGAPGCLLQAEPDVIVTLPLDATGAATLPLPIPLLLPTRTTFFAQAASTAPAANPLGLAFSQGLAIRLQ